MDPPHPSSTLFPYTTLFRSDVISNLLSDWPSTGLSHSVSLPGEPRRLLSILLKRKRPRRAASITHFCCSLTSVHTDLYDKPLTAQTSELMHMGKLHHAAHATHSAHATHIRCSRLVFRQISNHGFGGDHQASD